MYMHASPSKIEIMESQTKRIRERVKGGDGGKRVNVWSEKKRGRNRCIKER